MKVRRLTIDVLYDEKNTDSVEIVLDKMQSDWLHSECIAAWNQELGPANAPDEQEWDYFWEYDSEADIHRRRTDIP